MGVFVYLHTFASCYRFLMHLYSTSELRIGVYTVYVMLKVGS